MSIENIKFWDSYKLGGFMLNNEEHWYMIIPSFKWCSNYNFISHIDDKIAFLRFQVSFFKRIKL